VLLDELTAHFDLRQILNLWRASLKQFAPHQLAIAGVSQDLLRSFVGVGVFIWMAAAMLLNVVGYISLVLPSKATPDKVAEYLNTHTPTGALIETYESELFVFLNRRYHYPPDTLPVDLQSPTYFGIERPILYDPLAAAPDYLVTGFYSDEIHHGRIYGAAIQSGAFRLIAEFPMYKVYERVR
jgi:hypothetical protein